MHRSLSWLPVVVLLIASSAEAAVVQVKPTRVELPADQTSTLLTLTNTAPTPVRFQIAAFSWKNGADDEVNLTPSDDVTVYPTLMAIPPGASRVVRVGSRNRPTQGERSYRIIATELPPTVKEGQPGGVQVLTRLSIPVFVRGGTLRTHMTIKEVKLQEKRLEIEVVNDGDTYVVIKRVQVAGLDKAGGKVMDKEIKGWYVLAGDRRRYTLDFPEHAGKVAKVKVTAETSAGDLTSTASR